MVISQSEYLVRNQVRAAYQQDLVVQGVKGVLYKVLSVYCTSVLCVLCKVCSLYCTRCTVCIIQGVPSVFKSKARVKKEDYDISVFKNIGKSHFRG